MILQSMLLPPPPHHRLDFSRIERVRSRPWERGGILCRMVSSVHHDLACPVCERAHCWGQGHAGGGRDDYGEVLDSGDESMATLSIQIHVLGKATLLSLYLSVPR